MASWTPISVRWRIVLLLSAYAVVTASVLGGLLLKLRADAIADDKQLLAAIAQLADEQTSRTLENVEQTLQTIAAMLATAPTSVTGNTGRAGAEEIDAQLNRLVAARPYLLMIGVLDEEGRAIYNSDSGYAGLNLSDRAYFQHHRNNRELGFQLGAPIRNRTGHKWIIPVTRAVSGPKGEFAGVIVAALDPMFFNRVWSVDGDIQRLSVTLFRASGEMLMRSPFSEKLIGKSYAGEHVFQQVRLGLRAGTFQNVSGVDGEMRLFAYRQLTAYPNLILVTGHAREQALRGWWHIVWIVVAGWVVAALALGALTAWLIREWQARHATQERYRLLFDANPYAAAVIDAETRRFLAVNDAAVKQYGWSREECLAMTSNELYLPADLPAAKIVRREPKSDVMAAVRQARHRRKDGKVIDVETSVRRIEIDGRPAVLALSQDVTARHIVEQQLRQSQKMEAVGQLTGGIAHDFNNILTVILANADALQEEESLDAATLARRLERMSEAVQRASELTRQLLAFSRKQALTPKRTDLNTLVGATGKLLRRALGEQIVIESVLADGLWTVDIDRAQLETALVNLCVNARDAMPGGGKLLIETRNVTLDKDNVTLATDVAPGDYAMLSVTDTGSGIAAETLARVFEPFFTTKEVGKGTGLGLSMVYGFIKQSNGHITIHSELGLGTTFTLYLPRSDGQQEQAAVQQAAPMPRGGERILVVEDDVEVRTTTVEQLQMLGYCVTQAPDGTAAIASFEAVAQPYDLLLTDVVMPGGLNGKALADEVARRWPSTRVAFISGYAENALLREGQAAPGVLLLSKPYRKADLAQIVRQALDGAGTTTSAPTTSTMTGAMPRAA